VQVGAYLVADAQALELVEPGEGPLDHPTGFAQARAVGDAATGDERLDPTLPQQAAVLVEVVAPVGEQPAWPRTRASAQAPDRWDRVQERQELCDVMAVAAGQRDGERSAVPVDDQVVLAARPAPVDRRRSGVSPPLSALTCEPSIAESSISSRSAVRSSARRTSCKRSQMPASVQSRSRRQAVTPEQPTTWMGTSRQATPLRST
jgi:hypothetical protein